MTQFFGIEIQILETSAVIALVGILSYYFGRFVSDAKPQKEDMRITYIEGFYYLCIFVIFPFVLLFSIFFERLGLNLFVILTLIIQILIFGYLQRKFIGLNLISRLRLNEKVKEAMIYRTKKLLKNPKLKLLTKTKPKFDKGTKLFEKIFMSPIKKINAFITNFITISLTYYVVMQDTNLVLKYTSLIFTFLIISFVAFLSNYRKPEEVEVMFDKGSIKGYLNKIQEGYITIFTKNYSCNINKDKIKMIKRKSYDIEKLNKSLFRI